MSDDALYRPWGTVTPAFWTSPTASGAGLVARGLPSEALRTRLTRIAEIAQDDRLQDAAALALQLDQDITAEYGVVHLHTIQVREVRGYLAALTGDYTTGLGWYLHSAQLRVTIQGPGHPDVEEATRRAYSLWRAIPPEADRHRLGAELLTVVTDIHGPDALVARRTRERLYALGLPSTTLPRP
ncbi:hypothetical protein [Streptomyces sp. NBC_01615]|uniref:hypothetical protein n=1 Tax=Streptomyces sp. NBC_01615 TaxID=2975898 RepID=UPI003865C3A1